jgi:hypothetical protein
MYHISYSIDLQNDWHHRHCVIRIRKSKIKKDRQHNDQTKKDKRKNNDLQNSTQTTKDRATRTPLVSKRFSPKSSNLLEPIKCMNDANNKLPEIDARKLTKKKLFYI